MLINVHVIDIQFIHWHRIFLFPTIVCVIGTHHVSIPTRYVYTCYSYTVSYHLSILVV